MALATMIETAQIGRTIRIKFYDDGSFRIVDLVSKNAIDIPDEHTAAFAQAIAKRQPKTTKGRDAFNRAFAGEAL